MNKGKFKFLYFIKRAQVWTLFLGSYQVQAKLEHSTFVVELSLNIHYSTKLSSFTALDAVVECNLWILTTADTESNYGFCIPISNRTDHCVCVRSCFNFKIQEIFKGKERKRVPDYQCSMKVREAKEEEEEIGFKLNEFKTKLFHLFILNYDTNDIVLDLILISISGSKQHRFSIKIFFF